MVGALPTTPTTGSQAQARKTKEARGPVQHVATLFLSIRRQRRREIKLLRASNKLRLRARLAITPGLRPRADPNDPPLAPPAEERNLQTPGDPPAATARHYNLFRHAYSSNIIRAARGILAIE